MRKVEGYYLIIQCLSYIIHSIGRMNGAGGKAKMGEGKNEENEVFWLFFFFFNNQLKKWYWEVPVRSKP